MKQNSKRTFAEGIFSLIRSQWVVSTKRKQKKNFMEINVYLFSSPITFLTTFQYSISPRNWDHRSDSTRSTDFTSFFANLYILYHIMYQLQQYAILQFWKNFIIFIFRILQANLVFHSTFTNNFLSRLSQFSSITKQMHDDRTLEKLWSRDWLRVCEAMSQHRNA